MHFLTSIFQQSWKIFPCFISEKVYARPLMDALSGAYPALPSLTPGHAAIQQPLPVHSVGYANSPWPGKLLAASGASVLVAWEQQSLRQSNHRTLQEGRGLETAPIALVAADPWLVILFFFWITGISDGWKWKCRSTALTSVSTNWVNTCLDTAWRNTRSNRWLQFAMVSSIKPFQHFTTNWPQLRR